MRLCRRPTRLDLRLGDAAEQRPTGLTSPRRGSGVGGVSPPAPASCAEGGPGGRHSTWAASIPPCFGPGSAQAVVGIDLVSRTQPVRRQHHRGEIRGQKALAWSCLSVLKNPWYRPRPFTRSLGRAWPLTLVSDRMALAPPLLRAALPPGGQFSGPDDTGCRLGTFLTEKAIGFARRPSRRGQASWSTVLDVTPADASVGLLRLASSAQRRSRSAGPTTPVGLADIASAQDVDRVLGARRVGISACTRAPGPTPPHLRPCRGSSRTGRGYACRDETARVPIRATPEAARRRPRPSGGSVNPTTSGRIRTAHDSQGLGPCASIGDEPVAHVHYHAYE
jgi:hypothetical protein